MLEVAIVLSPPDAPSLPRYCRARYKGDRPVQTPEAPHVSDDLAHIHHPANATPNSAVDVKMVVSNG